MKPWMMAMVSGRRAQLVTVTQTSNGTLTIPAGVSTVTVSGYGAPGQPARQESQEGYTYREVITIYPWNGAAPFTVNGGSGSGSGPAPSNYCDGYVPPSGQENGNQVCYYFTGSATTITIPATTGAAASGIGKTFPGGVGGPATPVAYSNVPVTPGASYPVTVPPGGSITITYYI